MHVYHLPLSFSINLQVSIINPQFSLAIAGVIMDVKQREWWRCKTNSFGFVLERNHGQIVLEWTVYMTFPSFVKLLSIQRTCHQWLNVKPTGCPLI